MARTGKEWQGVAGSARQRGAWIGKAGHGVAGEVGNGSSGRGSVGRGRQG
jgi:hypothetical protein